MCAFPPAASPADTPAWRLSLLPVHNLSLAVLSSFLLVGIVHQLVLHWRVHSRSGVAWAAWVMFCDPSPHQVRSGLLMFFYYLNYLTKILELSDTVLLCLRGKPLHFLHVYHHAATLVLTWTQLVAKSGVQWVPIVLNLSVHVPMYYYYAVRSSRDLRARTAPRSFTSTLTDLCAPSFPLQTGRHSRPEPVVEEVPHHRPNCAVLH